MKICLDKTKVFRSSYWKNLAAGGADAEMCKCTALSSLYSFTSVRKWLCKSEKNGGINNKWYCLLKEWRYGAAQACSKLHEHLMFGLTKDWSNMLIAPLPVLGVWLQWQHHHFCSQWWCCRNLVELRSHEHHCFQFWLYHHTADGRRDPIFVPKLVLERT